MRLKNNLQKIESYSISFYGIFSVIVFIIMIFFGGLFDSVNALFYREISFIISPYSPYKEITIPFYRMYNINILLFSLFLFLRLKNIYAKIGTIYLCISALMGILLIHFPMDPNGASNSFQGASHNFVAMLMIIFVVVALFLIGYGLNRNNIFSRLSAISTFTSIFILLSGFFAGAFALLSMRSYVGLLEKLPIGAFVIWVLLTAIYLLKTNPNPKTVIKYVKRRKSRK